MVHRALNWALGWDVDKVKYQWPRITSRLALDHLATPNKTIHSEKSLLFYNHTCQKLMESAGRLPERKLSFPMSSMPPRQLKDEWYSFLVLGMFSAS